MFKPVAARDVVENLFSEPRNQRGKTSRLISGLGPFSPCGIAVSGTDLFVVNSFIGTIGEYTTSGATVNSSLISGLDGPLGIAIVGVPEPSNLMPLGLVLAGLGIYGWRRRTIQPAVLDNVEDDPKGLEVGAGAIR